MSSNHFNNVVNLIETPEYIQKELLDEIETSVLDNLVSAGGFECGAHEFRGDAFDEFRGLMSRAILAVDMYREKTNTDIINIIKAQKKVLSLEDMPEQALGNAFVIGMENGENPILDPIIEDEEPLMCEDESVSNTGVKLRLVKCSP